jgi:hypothetical protein
MKFAKERGRSIWHYQRRQAIRLYIKLLEKHSEKVSAKVQQEIFGFMHTQGRRRQAATYCTWVTGVWRLLLAPDLLVSVKAQ